MLLNEIINEVGMTKRAGQEFFVFLLKMGNPDFRTAHSFCQLCDFFLLAPISASIDVSLM